MTDFLCENTDWNETSSFSDDETRRFEDFKYTMNKTKEAILQETNDIHAKYGNVNLAELSECIDQIDVESIRAQNKELERNIESLTKKLEEREKQYIALKQDHQLTTCKIKEIYDTFLRAKAFYKRELNTYFTIESHTEDIYVVLIQFFTESRCSDDNYVIKLSRNTKTGKNELIETQPKLANFVQLKKRLAESNDVAGLLCCVRKSYINLRKDHMKSKKQ